MSSYYDYRYKFPAAGLALALDAIDALRLAGVLRPGGIPDNMLGDPIEQAGIVVAYGRQGRAGVSFTDETTGQVMTLPAAGDPAMIYIHIRATVAPEDLPPGFSPAAYGLTPSDPVESASVLGVWA